MASNSQNPGGLAGDAPFIPGGTVILFDLPRQEITSLAQLRHMLGGVPYEFGSAGAVDNTLFDTAFVSTVPRNFAAWDHTVNPRPNRYLEVYTPPQAPAAEFSDAGKQLASLRSVNSARYQLIKGAFNINSTSVEAWEAVLSSNVLGWRSQSAATDLINTFFRTPHGAQERSDTDVVTSGTLSDATTLPGVGRRLTAVEINTLATKIVAGIVGQGAPFDSLASFVNSKVLSVAITNAGLNTGITTSAYQHTAGAITQGDILASIAPFMSARSDTFKIRTYGDVINPVTGEVQARAWCEAVVQRTPDLLANPADTVANVVTAAAVTNPFGRKFEIISFRWLNRDDL